MSKIKILIMVFAVLFFASFSDMAAAGHCKKEFRAAKKVCKKEYRKGTADYISCRKTVKKEYRECKNSSSGSHGGDSSGYGGDSGGY